MKIAIIGLPNSGKTTCFNALTGQNVKVTGFSIGKSEHHLGTIKMPDERLDKLSEIFKPKKTTHIELSFIDMLAGQEKIGKGIDANLIKDVDALAHIIRLFEDENVPHPEENIDPVRDLEILETELILSDMDLLQNRLSKIEQEVKGDKKENQKEYELLTKLKDNLEKETPIREFKLTCDEEKLISGYKLLSQKSQVIIANIGEKQIGRDMPSGLIEKADKKNLKLIEFCGKLETEIAQIEEDERKEFMREMGIKKSATDKFIKACFETLGLISFFTTKGDETKAWAIRCGTTAWDAAGKIHSDIQRGFIKAEVINYDKFIECGSMQKAREEGLLMLESKDYVVCDGDIINFRFSV